jgi:hypothetical protein
LFAPFHPSTCMLKALAPLNYCYCCCCCSQLPLSTAVLLSIPIFASCKPYALTCAWLLAFVFALAAAAAHNPSFLQLIVLLSIPIFASCKPYAPHLRVFALAAAAHNSPFPQLFSCPSQFLHLVSLTPLTCACASCVCVCACCCCCSQPLLSTADRSPVHPNFCIL